MTKWYMLAKRDLAGVKPVSWERLQDQWDFSGEGLMSVVPFLGVMVLLVLVLFVVGAWRKGKFRHMNSTPVRIFYEIVRGIGLTKSDKRLLIHVAHHEGLPAPLTLLLSPSTFDHYAQKYARSVTPQRRGTLNRRFNRIRRVVFGMVGQTV